MRSTSPFLTGVFYDAGRSRWSKNLWMLVGLTGLGLAGLRVANLGVTNPERAGPELANLGIVTPGVANLDVTNLGVADLGVINDEPLELPGQVRDRSCNSARGDPPPPQCFLVEPIGNKSSSTPNWQLLLPGTGPGFEPLHEAMLEVH
jgi:hypothetical protein